MTLGKKSGQQAASPSAAELYKQFKLNYDPKKGQKLVTDTQQNSKNLEKMVYHTTPFHNEHTIQEDHSVKPLGHKKATCEIL